MSRRIGRVLWLAVVPLLLALPGAGHAQDPIGFGQTIEQQLDSSDPVLPSGGAFDAYTFTAEPGQTYVISGNSSEIPLFLSLYWADEATQTLALMQAAYVDSAGRQVQFSGVLDEPGSYLLVVQSSDPSLLGPYAVSLDEQAPAGQANCTGGTRDEPIPLAIGGSLSCALTSGDVQFGNEAGETFYGKFFRFESAGEEVTIAVQSDEIAPFIQVYADPGSTDVAAFGEGEVTVQTQPGPVLFAVLNLIPEGLGAFSVSLDAAGAGAP